MLVINILNLFEIMSFFSDLRKNSATNSKRSAMSARSTAKPQPTLINYEKREKLKQLLITKFMKKYNLKKYDPLIEQEITLFLHKEVLNEKDLKALDAKIEKMLLKKTKIENLAENLGGKDIPKDEANDIIENLKSDAGKPRIHTALVDKRGYNNDDCKSVRSGISGASRLSNAKPMKKDLNSDDIEILSVTQEPIDRVQFASEKDEWNAINKYNQQQFELDKITERQKDQKIKKRVKEDLDNQIKQKLTRINEERFKTKEYDKIAISHVDLLNQLEQDRKREVKENMLKEKENRDSQRLDEKKRKKVEEVKSKKYDQELCKL